MWKKREGIYLQIPDNLHIKGGINIFINDALTGLLKEHDFIKNMFVTTGKNSIAAVLRGTANKGVVTYCATGTSSVAPALSNTQLGTELARKLIATREPSDSADNASIFTTFYNTTESIGTIRELGLFGDLATATANSGTLYARAATNRVKSASDTLTIEWTLLIG